MSKADLSHSDLRSLLQTAVTAKVGASSSTWVWLRDVFDDKVVYTVEDSPAGTSKMFQASYLVGTDNSITLGDPQEVIQQTTYAPVVSMAVFSIEDAGAVEGECVVRSGKIFEVGDYPDKQFVLTVEEAAAAVAAFTPVDTDYEHISGPLDGKLGKLRKVWMGTDGKSIMGEYEEPTWLAKVLGDGARKVSTTWDRATKQLKGLALVTNPRVSDAVLMAAFAGARHNKTDQAALDAAHDAVVAAGANCAGATKETAKMGDENKDKEQEGRSFLANLLGEALFARLGGAAPQPAPGAGTVSQGTEQSQSSAPSDDPRIAALEKQMAEFRATTNQRTAELWADGVIGAQQALPADRPSLVAAYLSAAEDDFTHPRKVTFAKGSEQVEGTRVDMLVAQWAARPKHNLTQEMLPANFSVLPSNQSGDKTEQTAEEQAMERMLMESTPLGRAMLQEAAKNGTK